MAPQYSSPAKQAPQTVYDTQKFNLYSQINKELQSFYEEHINIAQGRSPEGSVRYLSKGNTGYAFNQHETVTLIDLYFNSKFETGDRDAQGQQKLFLNVGKFRTEVASKQIDIDTKDFVFVPEDYADRIGAYLMQSEFNEYVKESYFGELINECVDSFPRYGSVVLKKVGKKLEFVPIQTLRNDQTAQSLQVANYVIEEHADMSIGEILDMQKKGWNTVGFVMPFNKTTTVYERYGHMPRGYYDYLKNQPSSGNQDEVIDTVAICTIDQTPRSKKSLDSGFIFYVNEITERPYREAHWQRQHGRWLGIGEMENQFENQIAKNILVNLQKNSLAWSSKHLYQSTDPNVAKNLITEVRDGDVLNVGPQGQITQIDMASRSGGEFQQMFNEWEKNSDQKSFTYEVATGAALPSGTPFRLGVVLSNSVNSHFQLKQEKLGIMLKKAVMDFLIPEFEKKSMNGDNVVVVHGDSPGFEVLRQAAIDYMQTEAIRASIFNGKLVDVNLIQQVISPMSVAQQLFIKRPKAFYTGLSYKFDLVITGEEMDLNKRITSLTTLFQVLVQKGDPRADVVLQRIMALSGENVSLYSAPTQPKAPSAPITPAINQGMPGTGSPQPSGLSGVPTNTAPTIATSVQ